MNEEELYNKENNKDILITTIFFFAGLVFGCYLTYIYNEALYLFVGMLLSVILIITHAMFFTNNKLNEILRHTEYYNLGVEYVEKNFNNPDIKTWNELEKKYKQFSNKYDGFQMKCFRLGHDEALSRIKKEKKDELEQSKVNCLKNEMMKLIINADMEDIVSDQ